MTRKSDRPHANAVSGALEAFQAAAEGVIDPPPGVNLRDGDRVYWDAVVCARARDEWTTADLVAAGNLARCMADIERYQQELDDEGAVLVNDRGTQVMNPKFAIMEQLSRRHMALVRVLQMQATVTGQASEMAKRRKAERQAREIHRSLQDEESLLA